MVKEEERRNIRGSSSCCQLDTITVIIHGLENSQTIKRVAIDLELHLAH